MTQNSHMAHLLKEVDPGPGRWWKVSLVKNAGINPIKVTLMQSVIEGRDTPSHALSEPLAYVRTIASPQKVREAAEKVLTMVGDYAFVIGDYQINTQAEGAAA